MSILTSSLQLTKKRMIPSIVSIAILSVAPVTPAFGQDLKGDQSRSAVCMIGVSPAIESPTPIILPARDTAALLAEGFKIVPCPQAFADERAKIEWRDHICIWAATQPEGVQQQLQRLFGERPAVLCGMAEQVLGPWDRESAFSSR